MIYVTAPKPPKYHQLTLEELLFPQLRKPTVVGNVSATRTYKINYVAAKYRMYRNFDHMIQVLEDFNKMTEPLRSVERQSLYKTFYRPKKSGGLRRIDAPNDELYVALLQLKTILEQEFNASYHTCAFAYVKHRCTKDVLVKHQKNESQWFLKLDISNFFGSITLDFAMSMCSMIYPFCVVMETERGRDALRTALELGFLNGVLPQGTPLSPMLTNLLMIPIDHEISNALRDFKGNTFVYTRYADDFDISCRYSFSFREVEDFVESVFEEFHTPFHLKKEKTHYGSRSGKNWMLGLMLNKDNEITVGNKNKKDFQAMLYSYASDKKKGVSWPLEDIQRMDGIRSYYRSIEGEAIDRIVQHMSEKCSIDIQKEIKQDLTV